MLKFVVMINIAINLINYLQTRYGDIYRVCKSTWRPNSFMNSSTTVQVLPIVLLILYTNNLCPNDWNSMAIVFWHYHHMLQTESKMIETVVQLEQIKKQFVEDKSAFVQKFMTKIRETVLLVGRTIPMPLCSYHQVNWE